MFLSYPNEFLEMHNPNLARIQPRIWRTDLVLLAHMQYSLDSSQAQHRDK